MNYLVPNILMACFSFRVSTLLLVLNGEKNALFSTDKSVITQKQPLFQFKDLK